MAYEITAPDGAGDDEVAGIRFTDGRAQVADPNEGALLYFRRHGYTVRQDGPDGRPGTSPASRARSRRKES
ncbi:hypothetical protein CTZ27_26300 [Streptomyces griseocarneus]|nr:hypothetical protein CTZ27_26300 [Streptomyces griseocarneus]